MEFENIKKNALKENDVNKLIDLIEKYNLQDDKEVMKHFNNIDKEDTIEYSLYKRKK